MDVLNDFIPAPVIIKSLYYCLLFYNKTIILRFRIDMVIAIRFNMTVLNVFCWGAQIVMMTRIARQT